MLITSCPLAFAQQAPASLDTVLPQVTAAYSGDIGTAQRVAAWQTLIGAFEEKSKENKALVAGFLERMINERLGKRVTSKNTDIPVLVNFLKTFSPEEAIHILYVWIQANTNPVYVNGVYLPPETFMKGRTGDCTEVAWLVETVCRELGIDTKVFMARYGFWYSINTGIAAHAFTGLEYTENNIIKRYIIDNRSLYTLPPDDPWKDIVWRIYSQESQVWRYREVDTSLWRNVRRDSDDPQMRNSDTFVSFVLIPKDEAVKEFAGYDLSGYFDDPALETLFFRDDFRETITAQKQSGEITDQEYERLIGLWRKYENDGWRK